MSMLDILEATRRECGRESGRESGREEAFRIEEASKSDSNDPYWEYHIVSPEREEEGLMTLEYRETLREFEETEEMEGMQEKPEKPE
jgi:hypothetical protein